MFLLSLLFRIKNIITRIYSTWKTRKTKWHRKIRSYFSFHYYSARKLIPTKKKRGDIRELPPTDMPTPSGMVKNGIRDKREKRSGCLVKLQSARNMCTVGEADVVQKQWKRRRVIFKRTDERMRKRTIERAAGCVSTLLGGRCAWFIYPRLGNNIHR